MGNMFANGSDARVRVEAAFAFLRLRTHRELRGQVDEALKQADMVATPLGAGGCTIDREIVDEDHFALSVRYTVIRTGNRGAEVIQKLIGAGRTYNPNLFSKSQKPACGKYDGS